jgi:hypothetical protein
MTHRSWEITGVITGPSNSTSSIHSRKMKACPHKHLYTASSTVHNDPK